MVIGFRLAEVLSAAREGADWAWAELYRDLAPQLLRFLTAQGAVDPEDCLGETFVSLVRKLPDFDGEEPELRAFAFMVARSRLVDSWRKSSRRPTQAELTTFTEVQLPGADREMLGEVAVDEIIAELSVDQRSVVLLRVLHGFSVKESAEILGRSEGAIKALQHRAVTALRIGITDRLVPGMLDEG